MVFFFFIGLVSSSSSFHLCVEAIIWQKKDHKQIPKKLICGVQMGILSTYTVSRFLQISSSSKQIWCFCSRMYVCWGRRGGGLTSPIFAIDIEWQVQTLNSILVCEGGEETAIHNSASFT